MTSKLVPNVKYYKSGKVKRAYTFDKTGQRQGPYEEYYENGQLEIKCIYKDGKIDGPYEEYYENGQLCIKCTYRDGEFRGLYEEYYENGQPRRRCTFKDGEFNGSYEEYYENGQLRRKGNFKDGKVDGSYEEYYENGQLERKCTFKEDKVVEHEYYRKDERIVNDRGIDKISEKAKQRRELNANLKQIDEQMAPTQLRQIIKRAEVTLFRIKYPKSFDGR
ncbi:MAG: toxin-antitoxin system YwqK family antitoxin [Alphaproteobacteria bacterium]|nr:toxin-antitoxin system YwqK family antitoxin [Alphaproteobacteria bacterium]